MTPAELERDRERCQKIMAEHHRIARRNKQRKLQCEGQAFAGVRSTYGMV